MVDTAARRLTLRDPLPSARGHTGTPSAAGSREAVVEFLTELARSASDGGDLGASGCELTVLPPEWTSQAGGGGEAGGCGPLHAGDAFATLLGDVQRALQEGPYLDSLADAAPVLVPRIDHEMARWPAFALAARAHGLVSVHVEPLITNRRVMIGLAAWYGKRSTLGPEPGRERTARIPAITARLDLAHQLLGMRADLDTTRAALAAWRVIHAALEILTARHDCEADTAFDLLREDSANYSGKLHAAAAVLVDRTERDRR